MHASRPPAIARLGIFGGSFNPIHLAHLRSAEEVAEALRLDRVLFVPTASPPHKSPTELAAAPQRLAMVRRAIAGNPSFRVSAIELERPGRSYSIDTVRELQRRHQAATLFLIIGMDQFRELATWKDYGELLTACDLVVTSRPGQQFVVSLAPLPVAARAQFCYQASHKRYSHRTGTAIHFLRISDLDISASAIRSRVRRGASVRYLVPPSVHRYLLQHQLYRGRLKTVAGA
ncbi:MAG: nicotinate-nucleotide adenylyltransferase [Deltaproteobacteria bacterium]|nr:nicotinate-nucleotide adenylyltransferase [Deltaproteobacteria bacterium]